MVVDGVSLAKRPEIQGARSVLISQSPDLLFLKSGRELYKLPHGGVAGDLLNRLPSGMKGKLVSFEPPTQHPRTTAQRLLNDHQIYYKSVTPRPGVDLIVVLVPSASYSSSGYYNAAAGAYFSGGSSQGGHTLSIMTVGPSNVYSRLDALVFSAKDGSLVAETSVIATLNFKQLSEAFAISEMCSKSFAKTIFGVLPVE